MDELQRAITRGVDECGWNDQSVIQLLCRAIRDAKLTLASGQEVEHDFAAEVADQLSKQIAEEIGCAHENEQLHWSAGEIKVVDGEVWLEVSCECGDKGRIELFRSDIEWEL